MPVLEEHWCHALWTGHKDSGQRYRLSFQAGDFRSLQLEVWTMNQQHQHHLGACWKCSVRPTSPLHQTLNKFPREWTLVKHQSPWHCGSRRARGKIWANLQSRREESILQVHRVLKSPEIWDLRIGRTNTNRPVIGITIPGTWACCLMLPAECLHLGITGVNYGHKGPGDLIANPSL